MLCEGSGCSLDPGDGGPWEQWGAVGIYPSSPPRCKVDLSKSISTRVGPEKAFLSFQKKKSLGHHMLHTE